MPQVITRTMSPRALRSAETRTNPPANQRPAGADLVIVYLYIESLRLVERRLRRPDPKKLAKLTANIARFGILRPILVTADNEIVDGEMIVQACKQLHIERVPAIIVDGLSEAEVRTIRLAVNKLPEGRAWDEKELAKELTELLDIDATLIEFSGFDMQEVDRFLSDLVGPSDDDIPPEEAGPIISREGDMYIFADKHKLLCGNARYRRFYDFLLGTTKIQMVVTDPPFGCSNLCHASSTHEDFIEGSGMSEAEALVFFREFLGVVVDYLEDGAIVDIFIDGRSMFALLQAIRQAGLKQKALVTWDKGIGGMGSLYRQQAEFVVVTKWGSKPHVNNIQLGKHGRNRTTVWSVPGLAQTGPDRKKALELHPTIKPVALLMDAILDTSTLGGVILDPFAGTGSTLIAAHRTKRVGYGIELDPKYVDIAVARLEKVTGMPAVHAATGLTFAEIREKRLEESATRPADAVPVTA